MVIAVAAFAAYAFAWMSFPGRDILFVVIVGLLVVPLQVTLVPVLELLRNIQFGGFRLNGTFLAVWLAHTGYGLPFAVFLLRNYMGGCRARYSSRPPSMGPARRPRSSASRCR